MENHANTKMIPAPVNNFTHTVCLFVTSCLKYHIILFTDIPVFFFPPHSLQSPIHVQIVLRLVFLEQNWLAHFSHLNLLLVHPLWNERIELNGSKPIILYMSKLKLRALKWLTWGHWVWEWQCRNPNPVLSAPQCWVSFPRPVHLKL